MRGRQWVRDSPGGRGRRLPPVVPVVLYNGRRRWTAATELEEVRTMLTERVVDWTRQWKQAGRLEGRLEGRQEGEVLLLRRLLIRRFGPLPPWAEERLAQASAEQVETWGDRVLEAATLTEVLGPPGA